MCGWEDIRSRNQKRRRGIGAGDGIRTRDINLGKVALYQLSYSRVSGGRIHSRAPGWRKSNWGPELEDNLMKRTVIEMFQSVIGAAKRLVSF